MNFLVNTTYRTEAEEIMDDFSIAGPILNDALDKLAIINKLLGGNSVTLNGLKVLVKNQPKNKPITIIDLGCGGGDILRAIAQYGKKEGYNFQLIGVDANKNATDYAATLSTNYENISFVHVDVFSEEFKAMRYDIVITTLFLHHFKGAVLLQLVKHLVKTANMGIVVNDLHRHRLAYYLFKLITIPVKNKMIIEDGLTSVLRGFKRKELVDLSKQLNSNHQLNWKWAFRYQWILKSSEFKV
ncbi:methyltransferase family protein [Gelidibacter algens]|uniref:Methyltransferase family protein n=2 Tax=Gelidibacter algens TaxID=49280 RepID=A0A1A7R497_9FLAO|nr:methyltransferase domain-containing protein [Gelidibacter algens]OBX26676.1 methyltransferase [Gelidibacter algens]RAJ25739.1 methyltransferase family protein [Gelidibacter algens]